MCEINMPIFVQGNDLRITYKSYKLNKYDVLYFSKNMLMFEPKPGNRCSIVNCDDGIHFNVIYDSNGSFEITLLHKVPNDNRKWWQFWKDKELLVGVNAMYIGE